MAVLVVAPNHKWFEAWRQNQYPPRPLKDYIVLTGTDDAYRLQLSRQHVEQTVILDWPVRPDDCSAVMAAMRQRGLLP